MTQQNNTTGSKCAEEYVVKRGDSFYLIAHKLGVPLRDLLAANRDIHPARLMVGDVLCIPREEDDAVVDGMGSASGAGTASSGGTANGTGGTANANGAATGTGSANGAGTANSGGTANGAGGTANANGAVNGTGSASGTGTGAGTGTANGTGGTANTNGAATGTGSSSGAGTANNNGTANGTGGTASTNGAVNGTGSTNGNGAASNGTETPAAELTCPLDEQWTIQKGQTVSDIQLRNLVSRNTLNTANPDVDLDELRVGQTICVPKENVPCALPSTYTLAPTETLEAVAVRFNLPVASLLRANPCLAPQDFEPGVTVVLPR